ncbi:hypothetical protein DQ04_04981010, partial [Trypanosoma grayi]|uniref:hypothetical protein n=1 Tax=Trypanosoma grayi TaxID=71804 RepID=UPI0004F42944
FSILGVRHERNGTHLRDDSIGSKAISQFVTPLRRQQQPRGANARYKGGFGRAFTEGWSHRTGGAQNQEGAHRPSTEQSTALSMREVGPLQQYLPRT